VLLDVGLNSNVLVRMVRTLRLLILIDRLSLVLPCQLVVVPTAWGNFAIAKSGSSVDLTGLCLPGVDELVVAFDSDLSEALLVLLLKNLDWLGHLGEDEAEDDLGGACATNVNIHH